MHEVTVNNTNVTKPVRFVGPTGTCELMALRGNCGLDTKPQGAVPLDSYGEANGCAVDEEHAPACNCWRQCCAGSWIPV